jgi:DNA excision repair protein ERCC-5
MGVKGLWQHLSPAANRIGPEDLAYKRLAIDASIWAVQFSSFQQDDPLAHEQISAEMRVVEGFLRRILKLLFFGVRPVFVFDGQTPAIKRKCVQERQQNMLKGSSEAEVKKAAERLLTSVILN